MDTLPEAVLLAKELIQPHPAEAHAEVSPLLNGISVINAGLRSFADDLQSRAPLLFIISGTCRRWQ